MKSKFLLLLVVIGMFLVACKKDDPVVEDPAGPSVIFKFQFNENQVRLDGQGQPSEVPAGHAAQNPDFRRMSAHYLELAPTANTWVGEGDVLYEGPSTIAGGEEAIDFQEAIAVGEGETWLSLPLSDVAGGTYEYLRASLSYQEFEIDYLAQGFDLSGVLAGFIGYNTYITTFDVNGLPVEVNENKLQGYWAFQTLNQVVEGQAPEGATTVVNPLWDTAPIPPGSCLVTGQFEEPLVITGNETEDITVTISLSVNQSFEWTEVNEDGLYEPEAGEQVVDMGIRGMIPSWN